jgi:hypothetical protein
MKKLLVLLALAICSLEIRAQAKTTETLQANFDKSLALYFYKNTLRMLNQTENKEFDEMIKDIEKLKFLMVDKDAKSFGPSEYKKLKEDYKAEHFESIMTSRYQGRNFDVFFNDKKGSTPGTVVLVNDSSSLFVLDIVGRIDVSKVGALFSTIDGSTDIGKKIKDFVDHKDRDRHNKFDREDDEDTKDKKKSN